MGAVATAKMGRASLAALQGSAAHPRVRVRLLAGKSSLLVSNMMGPTAPEPTAGLERVRVESGGGS